MMRVVAFGLPCLAAALSARSPDAAGQIRLAYHGADGMTVSWNTFEQVDKPVVRWGRSRDNLTNVATSNVSVTYPTSTTYNNHVVVDGLSPDTTYYYVPSPLPQHDEKAVEPYTFTTARSVGASKAFAVAVAIDLGTMGRLGLTDHAGKGVPQEKILRPGEKNTIDSLAATKSSYDFLWHPGDIAYADYWLKMQIQGFVPDVSIPDGHMVYEAILNDFYDEMTVVTETKPYMVGPGNHEANCNNGHTVDKDHDKMYNVSICSPGQTNFTGYKNHFRMPSDVSGGTDNFWYSFDHGMAHFIQLDTETDLGHGFIAPDEVGGTEHEEADPVNATVNAQADWLAADLASVNRTKTPWIVVAGHRPWYLSKKNVTGSICWSCKTVFEPLFIKYKVDLVLTGHAHVYERLAPLADGNIDANELNNPSAPWYITNGAGGHYDGLDDLQPKRQPYSRFALDQYNATYGWSRLTFHNCTHLTHEFIASKNDSVLDTATLFKDRVCDLTGNEMQRPQQGSSTITAGSPSQSPTSPVTLVVGASTGVVSSSASAKSTASPMVACLNNILGLPHHVIAALAVTASVHLI